MCHGQDINICMNWKCSPIQSWTHLVALYGEHQKIKTKDNSDSSKGCQMISKENLQTRWTSDKSFDDIMVRDRVFNESQHNLCLPAVCSKTRLTYTMTTQ